LLAKASVLTHRIRQQAPDKNAPIIADRGVFIAL